MCYIHKLSRNKKKYEIRYTKVYKLALSSFVISIFAFVLVGCYFIFSPLAISEYKTNDGLTLILSIIGVLLGFSAINVYSIFHAQVDEKIDLVNTVLNNYNDIIDSHQVLADRLKQIQKDFMELRNIYNITSNMPIIYKLESLYYLISQVDMLQKECSSKQLTIAEQCNKKEELSNKKNILYKQLYPYWINNKDMFEKNRDYNKLFLLYRDFIIKLENNN